MSTTTRDDGGTAYPASEAHGLNTGMPGMSLRDHFAGLAMHQFLTGASIPRGADASELMAYVADRSYELANAMLKARAAS